MIHLTQGLLPIKVTGDVQYLINRNQNGWIVTLINNRGNYKPQQGLAEPRREEIAPVRLIPRVPVQAATMWQGDGQELLRRAAGETQSFEITLPAGGIRIIEFR